MDSDLFVLAHELIDEIEFIFPPDSSIEKDNYIGKNSVIYVCKISWKLNTEKDRPNKSSKEIHIVISEEVLDTYRSSSELKRQKIKNKFKSYIEDKYNNLEPNHDTPYGGLPPTEEWRFTTQEIN